MQGTKLERGLEVEGKVCLCSNNCTLVGGDEKLRSISSPGRSRFGRPLSLPQLHNPLTVVKQFSESTGKGQGKGCKTPRNKSGPN